MQKLIVQKYGGATLATPELVRQAAQRIKAQAQHGPLIVVVSAMGTTTNSLIDLANQVSRRPARRELDMLLSVGERISMSLMSMALLDLGTAAISFTGSQAGILTDDDHFNARIIDVKAQRVQDALSQGKIVILAGFQGVSPTTKEITTLGRGGSDVTAVAMAAALGAERCEILKEVPAVFSADPKIVANAKPLTHLNYPELLDMTLWGAKVLYHRSVEFARDRGVKLYIGPAAHEGAAGTLVGDVKTPFAKGSVISLNSHERVLEVELPTGSLEQNLSRWNDFLAQQQIPSPQFLGGSKKSPTLARVTAPKELLSGICDTFPINPLVRLKDQNLCSVTMTCAESVPADLQGKAQSLLSSRGITCMDTQESARSLTFFLKDSDLAKALEVLHTLI